MRQTFRHQIAAWALTAALTLTVQAADGVIEINQASVEAAGGFPFEITQAGSYRLTGNLEVDDVDTTAIWVRASYVTVDLNGFSILGPVLCDSDGACPERGDGAGVWAGPTLPGDDDLISPGENQNQPPIPIGVEVRNGVVSGMGHAGVGGIVEGLVETVRAIGCPAAFFVEQDFPFPVMISHHHVVGELALTLQVDMASVRRDPFRMCVDAQAPPCEIQVMDSIAAYVAVPVIAVPVPAMKTVRVEGPLGRGTQPHVVVNVRRRR